MDKRGKVKSGMPGLYYAGLAHASVEDKKDNRSYWLGRVEGSDDLFVKKDELLGRECMRKRKVARDKIERLSWIKQIAEGDL